MLQVPRRLKLFCVGTLLAFTCAASKPSIVRAQGDVVPLDQSDAKSRQLIRDALAALGGDAYLNVHDMTCTGQLSQFDLSGEAAGISQFTEYRQSPDKVRTEFTAKGSHNFLQYIIGMDGLDFTRGGVVMTVYNGDHGWSYDKSGVNDLPSATVDEFQQQWKRTVNYLLRYRLKEPDMYFSYGGPDFIDLTPVDWVNVMDNDNNTIRIAFAKSTHLPLRKVYRYHEPKTNFDITEEDVFSNYHPLQGVQTPYQTTRERNGKHSTQTFYDKCAYNTNVADAMFTKQSLDEKWAKDGKGKNNKKSEDKN